VPQGSLSPRNWAPHLSDPDDPEDTHVMTPAESKAAAAKVHELMQRLKK
jgi:hypothetical protein